MPGGTPHERENTRLSIDLMRGGFALMVMLAHGIEVTLARFGSDSNPGAGHGTLLKLLVATLGRGAFWVGGFFILSGLCIQWSVLAGLRKREGFLTSYFIARATRIYPLYLVAILIYVTIHVGIQAIGSPFEEPFSTAKLVSHIFMLQGVTGVIRPLGPAWSLTYECFYYLIWPLLLIAAAYRSNRALILGAFGCVMSAVTVGAVWKLSYHGSPDSVLVPVAMILFGFTTWAAGAWLATNWDSVARQISTRMACLATAGVAGAYLFQAWLQTRNAHQWVFLAAGIGSLPFWVAMLSGTRLWAIPRRLTGLAHFAGLLSYPLYLLHRLFIETFDRIVPVAKEGFLSQPFGYFTASFVAVLLACIAVGVPLEVAILRWRRGMLRAG